MSLACGSCFVASARMEGLICSPIIPNRLLKPGPEPSRATHLTVVIVPISAHQVDTVTVFIPEGSLVGQSTVGDGRVCVLVEGGEGPAIVVGHRVTWERENIDLRNPSWSFLWVLKGRTKGNNCKVLEWDGLELWTQI